ncbi:MAG: hypoxanthine phosphoribosyltransferase [Verrucomicrobiota bacterium]
MPRPARHSTSRAPSVAAKIPAYWRGKLDRVLIPESRLKRRVTELAHQLETEYADRELVIVAILNGTVMFLADLVRHLELPLRLDFLAVSSYGSGTSPGRLHFTKELKLDVRGRDVLLVDDILDTGRTLKAVTSRLKRLRPKSLKTCVLLNKQARRIEPIAADYVGFEIEDFFVVGYGLDFAEAYRNLPFIAVLKESIYRQP